MQLIIDRHLFARPLLVAVGDHLYQVRESDDSPVSALVPPAKGTPRAAYELRGVEVARVTHISDDGGPLSWARLSRGRAEAVIVAAGIGEVS